MKISKISSFRLSVFLGVLSLDPKDNLSSHSHLSNSQKLKLSWGAPCPTYACHHLENISIKKLHCHSICMSKIQRYTSLYTKRTEALLPDSAADFGHSGCLSLSFPSTLYLLKVTM